MKSKPKNDNKMAKEENLEEIADYYYNKYGVFSIDVIEDIIVNCRGNIELCSSMKLEFDTEYILRLDLIKWLGVRAILDLRIIGGRRNLSIAKTSPKLLEVITELMESAEYWSEYDVPLGIVDRMKQVIEQANK